MGSVCSGETDAHIEGVWGIILYYLNPKIMKSENHLIITGTVISDVAINPGQIHFRFRIIHNFGGGRPPLTLNCVQIVKPGTEPKLPQKGDAVRIRAYLRIHAERIEAVVKSIDIDGNNLIR